MIIYEFHYHRHVVVVVNIIMLTILFAQNILTQNGASKDTI